MLFNDDAIDDDDTDVYTAEVKTVDILTFHFVGACSKNHLQRINKGQVSWNSIVRLGIFLWCIT